METQAFALLCALGNVTFIATANRPQQAGPWLMGCLLGLFLVNPGWLGLPLAPLLAVEPTQTALLIFLLAFARIRKPSLGWPLQFGAGLLAALWMLALVTQGYPEPLVGVQMVAVSLVTWFAVLRRPRFRTPQLLEDALLIVMAVALALAVVPEVLTGWRAAVGLQAAGMGEAEETGNYAVLVVAAGFGLLGIVYAKWKESLRARWKAE